MGIFNGFNNGNTALINAYQNRIAEMELQNRLAAQARQKLIEENAILQAKLNNPYNTILNTTNCIYGLTDMFNAASGLGHAVGGFVSPIFNAINTAVGNNSPFSRQDEKKPAKPTITKIVEAKFVEDRDEMELYPDQVSQTIANIEYSCEHGGYDPYAIYLYGVEM